MGNFFFPALLTKVGGGDSLLFFKNLGKVAWRRKAGGVADQGKGKVGIF